MKRIIPVLALVLLLSGTITLASVTNYTETLPTFGHKTLAENQKTTNGSYAYHTPDTLGILYQCWIDSKLNDQSNTWTVVTNNHYAGGLPQTPPPTISVPYQQIPSIGKSVRLRSQKPEGEMFGGQWVSGEIDFR